jgi:beta-glucanase (GH16 family)
VSRLRCNQYSSCQEANHIDLAGGQSLGGAVTGAEIQSIEKMTSGHLSMNAQLSATHGTCQALFTYIDEAAYPLAGDEQDIEILAHHMDAGVVLTSWNPE